MTNKSECRSADVRRRRARSSIVPAAVVATVAALTLSGCGVPTSGPVNHVEEVPRDSRAAEDSADIREWKPTPKADETVEHFLRAAAGDWGGRDARLDEFVDGGWNWSEHSAGTLLVRLGQDDSSVELDGAREAQVEVTGRILGAYGQDGKVKPTSGDTEYRETFDLTRESASDTWELSDPPRHVALLDDEFEAQYESRPLYFHAVESPRDTLVPDLRWLPRFGSSEAQAHTQLVDWLLAGPSELIESTVVNSFPSGVARKSVTVDEGHVTVDVSSESAAASVDEFEGMSAQLAWSLGLEDDADLTLQVDGQERLTNRVSEWAGRNQAPTADDDDERLVYYIQDGVVVANDDQAPFAGEAPDGLQEAALEPGRNRMVAVVAEDDGQRLMQGAPTGEESGGEESGMSAIEGFSADELSDPQWLDRNRLLVLADGVLTVVDVESGDSQTVSGGADGGAMSAIALAPDGRRLAFVADDRAWNAPLSVTDDKVQLGMHHPVGIDVRDVADVGWSQETRLLVIGDQPGADEWLWEISVDNAFQAPVADAAHNVPKASSLAVRCNPPKRSDTVGQPAVVASPGGGVFRVFSSDTIELLEHETDDVDDENVEAVGTAPFVAS